MRKKLQIFISSTYLDLKLERQAAVEAVLRASHIPAGMELFSAGNESQLEIIKRWIEECDVYMLILGGRYGSLEPNSDLSYTEIEYRYALELGKPCFAIVIDESYLNQKVKEQGKDVLELDNPEKYKAFKKFVLSKVCRFFSNESDIKLAILESISDIQLRYKLTGWIKFEDAPDVTPLLTELSILRKKNTELEKQLNNGSTITKKELVIGDYSYIELSLILLNKHLTIPAKITGKEESKTSILEVFINYTSAFNIGIDNSSSTNAKHLFFFYHVAPVLLSFQLVEKVKVTGARWQMVQTSKLGYKFLAETEKLLSKSATTSDALNASEHIKKVE